MPSSGWMCSTSRLGAQPVDRRVAEEHERRALELDRDLGDALGQALAGAQVEGHVGPAPVVDQQLQRDERLGRSSRGRRAAPRGRPARARRQTPPRRTGRAPCASSTSSGSDRLDGVEHLRLLVAHGVGVERDGRLHRRQRDELEDVVRHHVAQAPRRARSSRRAARRPTVSADRDLHVVDVAAVPDRLEDAVGEAEDEDVLDRLLAQVVVDAVDLVLVEHARGSRRLSARAESRSRPERLLDDHPPPVAVLLVSQPGGAELPDRSRRRTRAPWPGSRSSCRGCRAARRPRRTARPGAVGSASLKSPER